MPWLPMSVTNFTTGVERDKWDIANSNLKVSRFPEPSKVQADTEQETHKYTDEELRRLAQYFDVLIEMDMDQKITRRDD